jgi:hypothetical protein
MSPVLPHDLTSCALRSSRTPAVRPEHNRLAVDREALGIDPPGSSRNNRQSRRPVIGVAIVEPHSGALPANDHPVTVMLEFVNPIAPEGGFEALTGWAGTNQAGRRLIFITWSARPARQQYRRRRFVVSFYHARVTAGKVARNRCSGQCIATYHRQVVAHLLPLQTDASQTTPKMAMI